MTLKINLSSLFGNDFVCLSYFVLVTQRDSAERTLMYSSV